MLVLEVEYLAGVAYAASAFDRAAPEWPPHPDRLFSALVCAWAERGEDPEECAVLEWLELLPPPEIAAPSAGQRDVVDVFVPPNDMEVPHGPLGHSEPPQLVRIIGLFRTTARTETQNAEGEEAGHLVEALGRRHGRGAETVRHGRRSKRWFETVRLPAKVASAQNKSSNNKHLAK